MKLPVNILTFLALVAFLFTGCKSVDKVVTARLEIQHGTNRAVIIQPKDTTITRLVLNPSSGLVLEGYQSIGNAAAIAASEAQYRFATDLMGQMQQQNMQMFQWLAQGGAQKYGINLPQGPAIGQPPFQIAPLINTTDGLEVVNLIATNAPVLVVPK